METNKVITDLKSANFNVEDEGTLDDYLVMNIQLFPDDKIDFSHNLFINQIIEDVQPYQSEISLETPFASKNILKLKYH